jgi:pimeloyl-ACP methyl ester carboxylesterase
MPKPTLETRSLSWGTHSIHTWRLQAATPLANVPTVVMMHGAGTADSTRAFGLAQTFAASGVTVISLDFVGHGKTGGAMEAMSLQLRTELALHVINYWTAPTGKLILCGFSMSGHTALRLTGRLGERITAISLMAPGIYAKEAEEVLFGDNFSKIIRQPDSWQNSLALQDAQKFSGRVHMLMSNHDQVIPWDVPEHLLRAFRTNAQEVRFDVLAGPDHKVAIWLSSHPEYGRRILEYLLGV